MLGKGAPPNLAGVYYVKKKKRRRKKRKGSLVGEGKRGKVCEVIRKSMPQAASHIDEKIISLLHRWLVKKNNPNLSKKLERKWPPSRELIKGSFVSFLSWENHRNKF